MGNCAEPLTDELVLATKQFNNQDWFDCHETLEDLWMGETGETRELYQGILQVAVALYHWKNRNFNGAISLLQSGQDHLSRVLPVCQQVDVAGLMVSAGNVRVALVSLGRDRMAELESTLIPRVQFVP
jgi:uncharacterized protein